MVKKIIITLFIIFLGINWAYAEWEKSTPPAVNCIGLPWCESKNIEDPSIDRRWDIIVNNTIQNIVSQMILYVWIISMVVFMINWVKYVESLWDEEKVWKYKKAIIYSIVWVIMSMSSYTIINLLNEFIFPINNTEENETS